MINTTMLGSNANNMSFVNADMFQNQQRCISAIKDRKQILMPLLPGKQSQESFTFDYVGAEEVSQEEIFQVVGKPIIDQCLQGYNGSIFAYGQTGSGKTYTIQGASNIYEQHPNRNSNLPMDDGDMQVDQQNLIKIDKNQRGLLPRSFEYLFQQICKIKNIHNIHSARGNKSARKSMASQNLPRFDENCQGIEFDVKCSYLEIYNENIIDLLDNTQNKLQIRESQERGVYAEPCTEETVTSIQDVMNLISKGARNRKIASTNMNRESSRSHAVFTAIIKTIQTLSNNAQIIKTARFHVVDLAGSERCKETGAEGLRLKEASMINKSLTTLSSVIMDLAEISCNDSTKAKSKHIRYRESKLTYLLKDSLGGNSKTVMICNVNPHLHAMKETLSALQFARRAKMIKNQAVINEENTSNTYWKEKYERDIVQIARSNTLPNPQLEPALNMIGQFCNNCKGQGTKQNQDKLLLDSQKQIKALTQQLKEEIDKNSMMQATYNNAVEETQKFRNQMKFQIRLKDSQLKRLLDDRSMTSESDNPYASELQSLYAQIDSFKSEIEILKQLVDANPLLAAKAAKIRELETVIQEQKKFESGEGVSNVLNKVLENIEKSIQYFEQNISKQRNLNLINESGDADMAEVSFNRTMNDVSFATVKRDQEFANIKLQYEDQLETLKSQLKYEITKNQKLANILSQKGSQATDNNVDEFLNSSQTFQNMIFNTQNLLLSQRTQNNNMLQSQNTDQFIEDMQQLVSDCQIQLQERNCKIEMLQQENDQHRGLIDDLNSKYEQVMRDKIELETTKFQFEDQLNMFTQQLQELTQENESLYSQKAELERVIEENEELKRSVSGYEDEIANLQSTNDYFSHNVIPTLQGSFKDLNDKCQKLIEENKGLQERLTKNLGVDELQKQISLLTSLCNTKESQLHELNMKLERTLQVMEEQKQYIICLNEKAVDDMNQINTLKQAKKETEAELNKYKMQQEEREQLLDELTKSVKVSEKKIRALEQEKSQKCEGYQQYIDKQAEDMKVLRSDCKYFETLLMQEKEKNELIKQQNSSLQQQVTDTQKKFETYKGIFNEQMEQSKKAMETIKRYRDSTSNKSSDLKDLSEKLRQENRELKDLIREKNATQASIETKLKSLEQMRDRMANRDGDIQKLRALERENVGLQGELEIFKTQVGQLESKLEMQESAFKDLAGRYDNLEKQNQQILNIGDSQKYQHLNQVRGQNNQNIKLLNETQGELKKKKEELAKIERRIRDQVQLIGQFGDTICQRLNVNKNAIRVKCEENLKEFLSDLLDLIVQGFTNQRLQLETPNNVSKQSESISSSSYDPSDDSRLQIFKTTSMEYFNPQQAKQKQLEQKQAQLNQQQLQNRKIVLHNSNDTTQENNQENVNANFNSNVNNNGQSMFKQPQQTFGTYGFGQQLSQFKQNNDKKPSSKNTINLKGNLFNGGGTIQAKNGTFGTQGNSNNNSFVMGRGGQPREPSNQRMDIDS